MAEEAAGAFVRRFSDSPLSNDGSAVEEATTTLVRRFSDSSSASVSSEEGQRCAICLGNLRRPQHFECGHIFCAVCVKGWCKACASGGSEPRSELLCPLCRTPLFDVEEAVKAAAKAIVAEEGIWQCDEAIELLHKVIEIDPVHPHALYYLSYGLETLGDRDGAITHLRLALKSEFISDQLAAAAWYNLGILLKDASDFAEAEAAYRHAMRLDPTAWKPHYNLGILHYNQGDYDEAEACYRHAIALDSSQDAVHYNVELARCCCC